MSITRLLFLACALTVGAVPARPQGSDPKLLSDRVAELERQVAALERRLRALEPPSQRAHDDTPGKAPGDWKQLANWRRLRHGMTMDEVTTALGQPDRVDATTYLVIWHYGELSGGSVSFDQGSKVSGWSEPRREQR